MATKKVLKTTEKKSTSSKKVAKKVSVRKTEQTPISKKTVASYSIKDNKSATVGELVKNNKKKIGLGLAVLIIAALLFYFKSFFIAAMVNGQPITRLELIQTLDKQQGKKTLNSLITKSLIFQEAQKRNIKISDSDVSKDLKKIEDSVTKQGQKLDLVLAAQGMTLSDLKERILLQKIVEKMLEKDLAVTDKEVNDYIEKNKQSFPEGLDEATIKEQAKAQVKQQKFDEKFQTFLDELQKKAKINIFVNF